MKRIVITGGTGFLGTKIIAACIAQGYSVTLVSRSPRSTPGYAVVGWDQLSTVVSSADVVMNLAGSSVGGPRWTWKVRKEILDSRIKATRAVVSAIRNAETPPVLINASAVGFYGDTMVPSSEAMGAGTTFLAEVTSAWEREAMLASDVTRVACMRIGVVLDPSQGALSKMLLPIKIGVGGPLGSGKQWFPWIHIDDVVRSFVWAIDNNLVHGPVNLVAPDACTMKQFVTTVAQVLRRPALFRVPEAVLRIVLGGQADIVVHGQHVLPTRLQVLGFGFTHPTLENALKDLLGIR